MPPAARVLAFARPRAAPFAAGLAAAASGLGVRFCLAGFLAKYGGVALWTCGVYAAVLATAPKTRPSRAFAWAPGIGWVVEAAQLTPGPAWLASRSTLSRLVLGAAFDVRDLPAYLAGAIVAAGLHRLLRS